MHYEKFADGTVKCIEDEIPFVLPEGWSWSRLQSFCFPITDGTHQTPTYSDEGYVFLSAKNVTKGKIDWDNVMHIPESLHKELYARIAPQKNDILLAKNGTVGVAAIVDRDCIFDIYVTLAVLRTISEGIVPQYLLTAILSSTVQAFFKSSLIGIGVQNLHLEHIRKTPVPIPPTREQKAIANQVNLLEPYILHIEEQKNELHTEIQHIKSKILDLAICGKLVPQNPDDEPASVLLERIRAEKEELIKQGKIKRDKKESIIFKGDDNSYYEKFFDGSLKCIDDEIPFDIPNKWSWTRVSSISEEVFAGGDKPKNFSKEQTEECQYAIYSNGVDKNGLYGFTDIPRVVKPSITVSGRGTIGFSCVRHDLFYPIIRLITITPSSLIYLEFLDCVFKQLLETGTGSSIPQLTVPMIKPKLMPIPPQKEQARIIKMISEIFAIILNAEKSLN